jgi:hypothetical protein
MTQHNPSELGSAFGSGDFGFAENHYVIFDVLETDEEEKK